MFNRKKVTLNQLMVIYGIGMSALIVSMMLIYGIKIITSGRAEIINNAESITAQYTSKLNHDMNGLTSSVISIYLNNASYRRIKDGHLNDFRWVEATYYIGNSLNEKAAALDFPGGYFFFDEDKNALRSVYNNLKLTVPKYQLDNKLTEILSEENEAGQNTRFININDEKYLVYYFKSGKTYLGYTLNLSHYLEANNDLVITYIYNDSIIEQCGYNAKTLTEDRINKICHGKEPYYLSRGLLSIPVSADYPGLALVFTFDSFHWSSLLRRADIWALIVLVPSLVSILLILLMRNQRAILQSLIFHLATRLEEMRNSENDSVRDPAPNRITGKSPYIPFKPDSSEIHPLIAPKRNHGGSAWEHKQIQVKEIEEINSQIDDILSQILRLQEDKLQQQQRIRDIQLQYYQIQIRPHFILNCLNTINMLAENKSTQAASSLIRSFSSYFRYVFRDQKVPVTVRDELREAKEYCNIYSIQGGVPILLNIEANEDVDECTLPILGILTFVENSIKYARKSDQILQIRISCRMIEDENRENLICINVSDNGDGFPEKILEKLNSPVAEYRFGSEHVGVENLKYRLALMYHGKAHWYFYNQPQNGAIAEITFPESTRKGEEEA